MIGAAGCGGRRRRRLRRRCGGQAAEAWGGATWPRAPAGLGQLRWRTRVACRYHTTHEQELRGTIARLCAHGKAEGESAALGAPLGVAVAATSGNLGWGKFRACIDVYRGAYCLQKEAPDLIMRCACCFKRWFRYKGHVASHVTAVNKFNKAGEEVVDPMEAGS